MYHVYQATEVSGLRKIPLSNILYKNFISNELNIKAKSLNLSDRQALDCQDTIYIQHILIACLHERGIHRIFPLSPWFAR
jgi:hypothetical protein